MKKTLKNLLVLSVVGCGLVLASCSSVQAKPNGLDDKLVNFTNDNTEWNDGKCPKCSIEWELFDIEKHRHSTTYFYQCPECKTVIDTAMDMTN